MGKTEILLLIASVAIGIALMVGMVVPIMKDGKDMVETRNLAQEMAAVKDKLTLNQIMKTYPAGDTVVSIGGTNFLETNVDGATKAAYPYKAKTTGAVFTKITYNGTSKIGTFDVNLTGTKAADVDFESSESLISICDSDMTIASDVITCKFKGN